MEPNDLKSSPSPDDAPLEAWLRTHAALPPLPDAGFAQRVLTALPAPPRRAGNAPRLIVIGLGAMAGLAFAAWPFLAGASIELHLPALDPETATALAQLTDPKLHAALGVTVLTLAFVFWSDLRRRVGL